LKRSNYPDPHCTVRVCPSSSFFFCYTLRYSSLKKKDYSNPVVCETASVDRVVESFEGGDSLSLQGVSTAGTAQTLKMDAGIFSPDFRFVLNQCGPG
jgi:hypothetical protein